MSEFELREAIAKRQILRFADGPELAQKELRAAKDDLRDRRDTLERGRYKWATTQAYYAMFHASRALLYLKKYREKSHIQLAKAVKALYVDTGLLPQEYYDNFIETMNLREMADYRTKFSRDGAERSIRAAEEAIGQAEGIVKKKS